ncbi:MAG TPA: hypothetical protein VMW79_09460 [Anaerolineae bacterium]|nr:hypothetical protein [Anaerolineae bacterium]
MPEAQFHPLALVQHLETYTFYVGVVNEYLTRAIVALDEPIPLGLIKLLHYP